MNNLLLQPFTDTPIQTNYYINQLHLTAYPNELADIATIKVIEQIEKKELIQARNNLYFITEREQYWNWIENDTPLDMNEIDFTGLSFDDDLPF